MRTENIGGRYDVKLAKRDWSHTSYKIHYSHKVIEEQKTPKVLTVNGCQSVMNLSEKGFYKLHSTKCLDAKNPRYYDDVPISQKCWREKRVYHATRTGIGDCDAFRKKGCEQIGSKFEKGGYQQTFRCPVRGKAETSTKLPGERPFCLTGNCEDLTDLDDVDFDQAIAQMALLNELGKQAGKVSIFSGQSKSCKSTKFKKCCFQSSGIAIKTGFSKCTSGEKELSLRRGKGHCVYVGKKSVKLHKIRIGFRKIYCCFPSKLLRVFQQQGRTQLAIGWGSAKHPNCRGFGIEEIQRLDFNKMDLSEALDEIKEHLTSINTSKVQSQMKRNYSPPLFLRSDRVFRQELKVWIKGFLDGLIRVESLPLTGANHRSYGTE